MSRPTPRWRRALSPILLVAAMLMLALGQLALYATHDLFDSDRFADRAVTALDTDEGRALVGARVADGIIARDPDLIGARPLLEGASEGVAASAPFDQLFRSVVEDLHRTVFGGDRDTIALKLADVGVLVIETLQSVAPDLARDIPKEIEPRLVALSDEEGSLLVDGARIAENTQWIALASLALAAALLAAAVAISPDRRRTVGRAALSVAALAILLVIGFEVGRALIGSRFDDQVTADGARAAWDALLGGLRTWNVVLAAVGLVIAAAAASLLRPLEAGAGARRAFGIVTTTPTRPGARAARAAALVAGGVAIVAAHELVLRLAVLGLGVFVLYAGVSEALRLALPAQERHARASALAGAPGGARYWRAWWPLWRARPWSASRWPEAPREPRSTSARATAAPICATEPSTRLPSPPPTTRCRPPTRRGGSSPRTNGRSHPSSRRASAAS